MLDAVVPTEVYRLKGPNLEIVYRRAHRELTFRTTEFGAELSGTRDAIGVTEPDIGIRVGANLSSSLNGKTMLMLLLPEMRMGLDDTVEVDGAAIITRAITTSEADTYPQQRYEITKLTGTVSFEVYPGRPPFTTQAAR